jgi:tetratricopeptide (TPR) repeat protein
MATIADNFLSGVAVEVVGGLALAGILGLLAASRIKTWLEHRRIKSPTEHKVTLLLAKLDGDTPSASMRETVRECIERELRRGVLVLKWPTALKLGDGLHEIAEAQALKTAHAWLRSKHADLLIWGRLKSPSIVSLRFTPAERDYTEPQTYSLTHDALELPATFISNLGVAIAAYAASTVQSALDLTTYVAPTLRTLSDRLEVLLDNGSANFDAATVATLNHCCARAKVRLYDFLGRDDDLRESIQLNRKALSLRNRSAFPDEWAASQNNLGACLARLGERTGVVSYFDEAEVALEAALLERTLEKSLVKNVGTRANLANVLMRRGQRESGNANLERAIRIFDEIAVPTLRVGHPRLYAVVQNNRGLALMSLAGRQVSRDSLDRSLDAFAESLEITTRETAPFDWADIKVNLGAALVALGERTGELPAFQSAIHELKDALEVIKRSRAPRTWAIAQGNLGAAQIIVGTESKDEDFLRDAVSSLNHALEVIKRDEDPILWNAAQVNLGRALTFLGELTASTQLLKEALVSFREVLKQPSSQSSPRDTVRVLNEYGLALSKLSELEPSYLDEALGIFEQLRTRLSPETAPYEWARAMFNLGRIQRFKGSEEKDRTYLEHSIETLLRCFDIFSLDGHRGQRAATHFELAKSHLAIAELGVAGSHLNRCREECRDALKVLEREPNNNLVTEIRDVLERADELERS